MTKYHAIPTEVDGIRFASKKEAKRYGELKLLERAGAIKDLVDHPEWDIQVNGHKICVVKLDFEYYDCGRRQTVHEDVKSKPTDTPVSRLKRKLLYAVHGVSVELV